jgi:Reeler domain
MYQTTQIFTLLALFAFSKTSVKMNAAAVEEVIQPAMEMMACSRQSPVAADAVRKRPDGLYNIFVFRENTVLSSFVAGQTYMVSVAAVRPSPLARRITDFKLVVARQYSSEENDVVTGGTFRNIDGQQTTINVACPHIVSAGVGFRARTEVLVTWTAPRLNGDCVEFR